MIERFLISVAIVLLFFMSNIFDMTVQFLNCQQIDENYYISSFLIEQCNNNERYSFWKYFFIWPCFLFFIIIVPFVFFLFMFKNRKRLFEEDVIVKIGFLLNGYSTETFYWYKIKSNKWYYYRNYYLFFREFIFLLRKFFLIIIISFGNVGSGEVIAQNNAYFCVILCAFSFWLQVKDEPFITKELNDLNFDSSLTMILTIFLGIFSSSCENLLLQTILLISMMLLNIYFFFKIMKAIIILKVSLGKQEKTSQFVSKAISKLWSKGMINIFFSNYYSFRN